MWFHNILGELKDWINSRIDSICRSLFYSTIRELSRLSRLRYASSRAQMTMLVCSTHYVTTSNFLQLVLSPLVKQARHLPPRWVRKESSQQP